MDIKTGVNPKNNYLNYHLMLNTSNHHKETLPTMPPRQNNNPQDENPKEPNPYRQTTHPKETRPLPPSLAERLPRNPLKNKPTENMKTK
jgi:hypothetical protein